MIELSRRLVPLRRPACAAIGAYVGAAVIGFNHAVRISGINPQAMIVTMGNANRPKSAPTINGTVHPGIQHIYTFRRPWIGKNMGVVKSPLAILAVAVDQRPGFSAIVGTE